MTTTINASTSGGLVQTADTSGILALQTANTTAMTINASQNVGVGTTDMSVSGANAKFAVSGGVLNLDDSYALTWGGGTGRPSINGNKASQYVVINTNGSERMRIDSSGNVGIGTSSPTRRLHLAASTTCDMAIQCGNTTDYSYLYFGDSDSATQGWVGYYNTEDSMRFGANGAERMRITSAGNVGIGNSATSPTGLLTLRDTNDISFIMSKSGVGAFDITNAGTSGVTLGTQDPYLLAFKTNQTERMRVQSDGITLINGTASADSNARLQVFSYSGNSNSGWIGSFTGGSGGGRANQTVGYMIGQTNLQLYTTWDGSGNPRNSVYVSAVSSGVQLTSGATSWSAISDERQKDIIEPITDAVNKVSTLRTVIGKYKNDEEGKRRAFLIAQDVQAVLPEAISIEDEGQESEKLLLAYTDVIPLLAAAIKEQQALITDLTTRLAALEGAK